MSGHSLIIWLYGTSHKSHHGEMRLSPNTAVYCILCLLWHWMQFTEMFWVRGILTRKSPRLRRRSERSRQTAVRKGPHPPGDHWRWPGLSLEEAIRKVWIKRCTFGYNVSASVMMYTERAWLPVRSPMSCTAPCVLDLQGGKGRQSDPSPQHKLSKWLLFNRLFDTETYTYCIYTYCIYPYTYITVNGSSKASLSLN